MIFLIIAFNLEDIRTKHNSQMCYMRGMCVEVVFSNTVY